MTLAQVRDQALHFFAAFTIILLAWLFGSDISPIAGGVIGLCADAVREFTEWQAKPTHGPSPLEGHGSLLSPGSLLDAAFWALGGLFGGIIL